MFAVPAALAQDSTSRAVVQPLPTKEVQRLNRALLRLAKRPESLDALLEAGDAALAVRDLDAAMGFYGRAENVSPNDARVRLGKAQVFLLAGRPVEALPLFTAAESAGARPRDLLSDRGLAFDLVGDNANAQLDYKRAIDLDRKDDEAKRRLALSYAITGNRAGFEETLRPLLDRRDYASFRTRAFGLAILGEQERAAAIVDAVMPRDLASRINPYLAYMPRLTRAQQAAAANIGKFPIAADIGRDDPQIAAFVAGDRTGTGGQSAMQRVVNAQRADSRLAPAGEPLGSSEQRVAETVATASVEDAFADMGGSDMPTENAREGAVNLAAIQIPREAPPEPAPPAEPEHPSRIWVQVATGRDLSALKFDWRRLSRRVPALLGDMTPYTVPWGQANRLLTGPVADRSEARELINALKAEGIETFRFTSPEGMEIKELK